MLLLITLDGVTVITTMLAITMAGEQHSTLWHFPLWLQLLLECPTASPAALE